MSPRPRRDEDPARSFARQDPTYWLSPGLLLRASGYALVSGLLGRYQDKRESMGSLPADDPLDLRTGRDEVWFDFVSDTGDGFDATYAIASLVGRPALDLAAGDDAGAGVRYPRGELLVLGGDECYPRGEMEEYEHRFIGPYRAAFPGDASDPRPPWMLAVPGNHDWYDGLTAFTRTFCQSRRIGGWRTTQSRSYFAVSLPGRWWLWSIDIQFDSYVDVVQHRWLSGMAEQLRPGDGVILCTAKPAWTSVHANPEDYRTVDFVERTFVEPAGAEIRMVLSGDKHHYSRYEAADGRQLVTAGGGGAYLTSTHHLPDAAEVPSPRSTDRRRGEPVRFERRCRFPDAETSRALGLGVWRLPLTTPGFAALVGVLHVLPALGMLWMLGAGPAQLGDRLRTAAEAMPDLGWVDTLALLGDSIGNLLLAGLVLAATVGLTKQTRPIALALGLGHGLVHLAVAVTTTWLGARLAGALLDGDLALLSILLVLAVVLVVGASLGAELVALSLVVGDRWGVNANELFAAQAIADHKNFLRIHVDRSGAVTVHPVGLAEVPRAWREPAGWPSDGPRIDPVQPMEPRLIEAPFQVWPPQEGP